MIHFFIQLPSLKNLRTLAPVLYTDTLQSYSSFCTQNREFEFSVYFDPQKIVHSQKLYFLKFINFFVRMLQCKETLIFMTSFIKYCQKYFSKIEIFPYCLHCPSISSNIIHILKCGL